MGNKGSSSVDKDFGSPDSRTRSWSFNGMISRARRSSKGPFRERSSSLSDANKKKGSSAKQGQDQQVVRRELFKSGNSEEIPASARREMYRQSRHSAEMPLALQRQLLKQLTSHSEERAPPPGSLGQRLQQASLSQVLAAGGTGNKSMGQNLPEKTPTFTSQVQQHSQMSFTPQMSSANNVSVDQVKMQPGQVKMQSTQVIMQMTSAGEKKASLTSARHAQQTDVASHAVSASSDSEPRSAAVAILNTGVARVTPSDKRDDTSPERSHTTDSGYSTACRNNAPHDKMADADQLRTISHTLYSDRLLELVKRRGMASMNRDMSLSQNSMLASMTADRLRRGKSSSLQSLTSYKSQSRSHNTTYENLSDPESNTEDFEEEFEIRPRTYSATILELSARNKTKIAMGATGAMIRHVQKDDSSPNNPYATKAQKILVARALKSENPVQDSSTDRKTSPDTQVKSAASFDELKSLRKEPIRIPIPLQQYAIPISHHRPPIGNLSPLPEVHENGTLSASAPTHSGHIQKFFPEQNTGGFSEVENISQMDNLSHEDNFSQMGRFSHTSNYSQMGRFSHTSNYSPMGRCSHGGGLSQHGSLDDMVLEQDRSNSLSVLIPRTRKSVPTRLSREVVSQLDEDYLHCRSQSVSSLRARLYLPQFGSAGLLAQVQSPERAWNYSVCSLADFPKSSSGNFTGDGQGKLLRIL